MKKLDSDNLLALNDYQHKLESLTIEYSRANQRHDSAKMYAWFGGVWLVAIVLRAVFNIDDGGDFAFATLGLPLGGVALIWFWGVRVSYDKRKLQRERIENLEDCVELYKGLTNHL